MARRRGLSVFFPCFIPEYDAVCVSGNLQKGIVLFSCFTQFWACNEADEPHFSALYTPKLHLCTLVTMPGSPFSHTPKHHLGCPILPFGVSHFTIWGIFSAHLRTMYSPDFRFVFFVFVAKVCVFLSFRFIMFFMIHLAG